MEQFGSHAVTHPQGTDGMADSVDPDQTASEGAVWSGSALFAQTYLSQYLEFLWLIKNYKCFNQETFLSRSCDIC